MSSAPSESTEPSAPNILAAAALHHFQKRAYDDSVKCLHQIPKPQATSEQMQIAHNVAIAEYFRDCCRDPAKLLHALQRIRHELDVRPDSLLSGCGSEAYDLAAVSVVLYNEAVLHFQLKQYEIALGQLAALFRVIDAVDDWLAVRICMLLVEVFVAQRHADRAWEAIAQLEKLHAALTNKPQTPNATDSPASTTPAQDTDTPTSTTQQGQVPSVEPYPTPSAPSINTTELSSALHICKARVYLLQRMFKPAKKELKAALSTNDQQHILVFLRANLEYMRQNWPKAVKLLNSCKKTASDALLPALYLNNMGCIHSRMEKHAAAGFYFARAINKNYEFVHRLRVAAATGLPSSAPTKTLYAFSRDRSCEILCNTGLTFLLSNKPELAFACFQQGLGAFFNKPRYWLRLGEACIAQYVLNDKETEKGLRSVALHSEAGSGRYHRYRIRTSSSRPILPPAAGSNQPSLGYGQLCFRNALYLLGLHEHHVATQPTSESAIPLADKATLHAMQQSALLGLAYVSLALNDGLVAFDACMKLLQTQPSPQALFLCHVYAAEALVRLDRPYDAVEHLSPALLSDITERAKVDEATPGDFEATFGVEARCTLYVNLAAVHIIQDQLPQAEQCIQQALSASSTFLPALLSFAYLELRRGRPESALQVLLKYRVAPAPV